jgi:hypothetical protein
MQDQPPPNFICCLTMCVMEDPVFTVDAQTYERTAIEQWLTSRNTSPLTGAVLRDKTLRSNYALRGAIEHWISQRNSFQHAIHVNDLRLNTSAVELERLTDADRQTCPLYNQLQSLSREQKRRAEIGVGQDKSVYRGFWKSKNVAILHMRRGSCDTEARIFTLLGRHPHLVKFYGVAVGEDGSQNLVTELAPLGSMENVLEQNRSTLRSMGIEKKRKIFLEAMIQVVQRFCVHVKLFGMVEGLQKL